MGQLQHPVLGTLEVPDRLLEPDNRQELEQNLLQLAADTLPQDEAWYETFTKQFGRTASETARGIGELTGITEKPEDDYTVEFVRRARAIQNPKSAFAGEIGGAIGDVPSYLFGGVARKGAGLLEQGLTRGASVGGVSGALTPVYDMFGDDRLDNAAIGAALGGILGGAGGVILKRLGYQTEEELADALRKASPEERARLEGEMETAVMETTPKATTSEGVPTANKPDAVAEAEAAQARATDPIRREADAQRFELETQDYTVRVQKAVDDLQAEVDQLPKRGQVKQFENAVKEHNSVIKAQENKLANLNKAIKAISNSKVAPKAQRAKIKMLETEKQRVQQKIDERVQLRDQRDAPLLNRINYLKGVRKELDSYYKEGSLPNAVIDVVGEPPKPPQAPVIDEQYTTAPTVQTPAQQAPVSSDVPMGVEPPAMPTQQVVQAPAPVQTATAAPAQTPTPVQQPVQAVQAAAPVQTPTPQQPVQPTAPPVTAQPARAQQPTTAASGYNPIAPEELPQESVTRVVNEAVASAPRNKVVEAVDRGLGALSTRLRDKFPPVFQALRKYELDVSSKTAARIRDSKPFFDEINRLSPEMNAQIKGLLYNGKFDDVMKLISPEAKKAFTLVRKDLRKVQAEARSVGIELGNVENYFPRRVADIDGLRDALSRTNRGEMTAAIENYKSKNNIDTLTPDQEADIINKVVRNVYKKQIVNLGSKGARTVSEVPNDLLKFYEEPSSSLTAYYQRMTDEIEKTKFFGGNTVKDSEGNVRVEGSIGNVIANARLAGNLGAAEERALLGMLQARFIEGEKAMGMVWATGRDLGYAGTIGNVISAITNLGDLGTSAGLHGIRNTVKGLLGVGTSNKYNVVDMGIDHTIAHELRDGRKTAQWLNGAFKYSGFAAIDRLGKNTVVNAAMRKNEKLAMTDKGKQKIRQKWSKAFGDETESLINDLEKGNITDNTKLLAFHELSDVQPVSLSEMPEWYLKHPDGRLLYMLKSFTLKQFDIIRREIVGEFKKGNSDEAIKRAFALASYVTAANVGAQTAKDFFQGREIRPEDLPSKSMWTLLGVLGMNQYVAGRYLSQGDLGGAITSTLLPPMPLLESGKKLTQESKKYMEDEEYNFAKASRAIPIVGPLVYSWFGGGRENYNERLDD